jgi:pimeloyl-ACP methyl ester carboxylesterase
MSGDSRRTFPKPAPRRALRCLVPAIASLALAACAGLRPAEAPLRTVALRETPGARCLFVFLPGRHSRPEDFARTGFATAAAKRQLAADLIGVDAHLGYYRNRSVVERLHVDVLAPRRERYEEVWVVGTSLGGLGGLLLLREHPEDVEGILTLAPFLGPDEVIAEIAAAGGPRAWVPPAVPAPDDPGRALWAALREVDWPSAAPLYVGWGARDRFAAANEMLGALLPPERVFRVGGGHSLATWRGIWEQFLDRTGVCRAEDAGVTGR